MTRDQSIAVISEKLASLGDEELSCVADHVEGLDGRSGLRQLTDRELALIEQSKADFAAGRDYTLEDARALSDELIKSWRQKYPSAP